MWQNFVFKNLLFEHREFRHFRQFLKNSADAYATHRYNQLHTETFPGDYGWKHPSPEKGGWRAQNM